MKNVLGIGNALVDILLKIDNDEILKDFNLPKGSMQLIDEYDRLKIFEKIGQMPTEQAAGGCAANTVHGLANLGIPCGFIGKVGTSDLGKFFQEDLQKSGIEPHLSYSFNKTGTAIAFISPDSERTFATYLGAAVEMSPDELSSVLFSKYDVFHIEGYLLQNHDLIQRAVKLAKDNDMKVSLDLASYNVVLENLEFLKSLVHLYVDIVFANEEEAKAFTGFDDPKKALTKIAGGSKIAVVKLGKNGSLVQNGKEIVEISPIKVNSIDTTGAGDLYAAGFLYGLINNMGMDKCGAHGSLLAGTVIENIGAKISTSQWENIKLKMKGI
jgi:sugar/nucleoside kinase (ribokinase family)